MDLQALAWLLGAIVAGLTVYNFVKGAGRKEAENEAEVKKHDQFENHWNVQFDALHNSFNLYQAQTSDRFEKVMDRLNDALLTMAREHPTKLDLQMMKQEIIDRIDMRTRDANKPKVVDG